MNGIENGEWRMNSNLSPDPSPQGEGRVTSVYNACYNIHSQFSILHSFTIIPPYRYILCCMCIPCCIGRYLRNYIRRNCEIDTYTANYKYNVNRRSTVPPVRATVPARLHNIRPAISERQRRSGLLRRIRGGSSGPRQRPATTERSPVPPATHRYIRGPTGIWVLNLSSFFCF
jgi:hypothetical protein